MPNLRWALAGLAVLAGAALLVAACGDHDGGKSGTANDGSSDDPTAATTAVSDQEYMKVFCVGLDHFYDLALSSTSTKDEMVTAIRDYVASLKSVQPQDDVRDFHQKYTKYLEGFADDPASLLASPPPVPPDDVRSRLSDVQSKVPECRYPTFLGKSQDTSP